MPVTIRPFRRSDRDQVTALVNAHAAAVVPGLAASVNTVLSQLEREPGEFIVDPWVCERATLVAEQRGRVSAAAHLLRFSGDDRVGDAFRGAGDIRWFLYWPGAPYWPDSAEAGDALLAACIGQFERWGVSRQYADGNLPVPAVYGVPEQWPHIRAAYDRAGFEPQGQTEILFAADVAALPDPGEPPLAGLSIRRTLGTSGTRLSADLGGTAIGYIEVEQRSDPARMPQHQSWADIGNLEVDDEYGGRGLDTWLLAQAADWLRLAGIQRLLGYAQPGDADEAFFERTPGFRELSRTVRGWERTVGA